jgi:dipeptidyl aminopeptidase/acylaminoacyl peptidase
VHGDNDTFIPAASAESFVDALRGVSMNPVVYARLPGAQHSFDLLDSVRFQHVIDGIETFTAWVRGRRDPPSDAQLTAASPRNRAIPAEDP